MSNMNDNYKNALAAEGASLITHIGLIDDSDVELSGGDYERQPVTWTSPTGGLIRPTATLVFEVPAVTIKGWRGYSALEEGTDYGGFNFTNPAVYAEAGTLVLLAEQTGILHNGT